MPTLIEKSSTDDVPFRTFVEGDGRYCRRLREWRFVLLELRLASLAPRAAFSAPPLCRGRYARLMGQKTDISHAGGLTKFWSAYLRTN